MNICLTCGRELAGEDLELGVCPDCGASLGAAPEDSSDVVE